MTLLRIAVLLVMAGLSTGCLRMTYALNLKPDGSGTIVQTIAMSKAALASAMGVLMEALEVKEAPPDTLGPIPFMTEQELKDAAAAMGAGVRFVGVTPVADDTLEGQTATFAFDDIRKLPLNLASMMAGGLSDKAGAKEIPADARIGVTFTRENGRSILVLDLPELEEAEAKRRLAEIPKPDKAIDKPEADVPPELAKMMQEMLAGFYIEVALNFEGNIISTDAPFVDGTKLVLLQMDFGEMLKTGKGLDDVVEKLQSVPDNLVKMFEMPGLKAVTQRKIRIEFR